MSIYRKKHVVEDNCSDIIPYSINIVAFTIYDFILCSIRIPKYT